MKIFETVSSKKIKIILIPLTFIFINWGGTGHKIINEKAVLSFPVAMSYYNTWQSGLGSHASDADSRKSSDPNEAPKHYIDIDNYPSFVSSGYINQNFDSLVAIHGYSFVLDQGILPWAILTTMDSLTQQFARGDMSKALLTAADLGHYVGDGHMPLHITRNYNGQYSGQSGIHSRYESNMINRYSSQINYSGRTLNYVNERSNYVFQMLYENYNYVDTLLAADLTAKSTAGNTSSDLYYSTLWNLTKNFTIHLFSNASSRLAELIYTCWIDGGSPNVTGVKEFDFLPQFELYQNYPNPFNPSTVISYQLSASGYVELKIFDVLGNEVAMLIDNEWRETGYHNYQLLIINYQLPSGIYFYSLTAGEFTATKKFVFLK